MRIFGYILGFLLLSFGVMYAVTPRWWTDRVIDATENVVPQAAGTLEDYRRLSSPSVRSYGFAESAVGLAILALASRIPTRGGRH